MSREYRLFVVFGCMALGLLTAGPAPSQTKIPTPGTERWRVQYPDSTVSLNDLCPVLERNLGASQIPMYVNGLPIGFC
ncbi:MAG: hypothetical protein R3B81_04145 [bacterium]